MSIQAGYVHEDIQRVIQVHTADHPDGLGYHAEYEFGNKFAGLGYAVKMNAAEQLYLVRNGEHILGTLQEVTPQNIATIAVAGTLVFRMKYTSHQADANVGGYPLAGQRIIGASHTDDVHGYVRAPGYGVSSEAGEAQGQVIRWVPNTLAEPLNNGDHGLIYVNFP